MNLNPTYNGRQFYEYIEIMVPFEQNSRSQMVSTTQFMEQYYKSIRQLTMDMQAYDFSPASQWAIDVLVSNWNAMKAMNHGNLNYYDLMGQDLIRLLTKQTYTLVAIFILTSAFKTFLFYAMNLKSQVKTNESLNLHERLTTAEVRQCCEHY